MNVDYETHMFKLTSGILSYWRRKPLDLCYNIFGSNKSNNRL